MTTYRQRFESARAAGAARAGGWGMAARDCAKWEKAS